MYICENCGEIFNEPRTYYESHGFTDGRYEQRSCCPVCGGGYEELKVAITSKDLEETAL